MSKREYYFAKCGNGIWPNVRPEAAPDYAVVFVRGDDGYWVRAGRLYQFRHEFSAKTKPKRAPAMGFHRKMGEHNNGAGDGPGSCMMTNVSMWGWCHPNMEQWIDHGLIDPEQVGDLRNVAVNTNGNWLRGSAKVSRIPQSGEQVLRLSMPQGFFKPGGNR